MFGKKIVESVAPSIYKDGVKPVLEPLGKTAGLIPRTINAVLVPVEKWVLGREYNLAETKQMLEHKLNHFSPEHIVSPDAHIAVPAIQYISYCMDNIELKEMYANLLANSMLSFTKDGVHPAFVEIIKQLSPDEAKILRYIYKNGTLPTISVRYTNEEGAGITVLVNFSNVGELAECERPLDVSKYFDNLMRLGLIKGGELFSKLVDDSKYDVLREHPFVVETANNAENNDDLNKAAYVDSFIDMTIFGRAFCSICIDAPCENSEYKQI